MPLRRHWHDTFRGKLQETSTEDTDGTRYDAATGGKSTQKKRNLVELSSSETSSSEGEATPVNVAHLNVAQFQQLVFSGGYEDNKDHGDVIEYTGHGGQATSKQQAADQKLVRGNKAMKEAHSRGYAIRVIRGTVDARSPSKMLYTYDGLFEIFKSNLEIGKGGYKVWKFYLRRIAGPPGV